MLPMKAVSDMKHYRSFSDKYDNRGTLGIFEVLKTIRHIILWKKFSVNLPEPKIPNLSLISNPELRVKLIFIE